ncbi:MAG TPA: lysophospholipid acyltransferase family protein [Rhodocyclaceae bacterium]|nr:lysophospholipid acyltransferase family protein [Rhodocyclaceae bacterium]
MTLQKIFRWLSRLSLPTLHRLGATAGLATYGLSKSYRRRLRANMTLAIQRAPSSHELHAAACEAGKLLFELPYVWLRPYAQMLSHVVEVEGWEVMDAFAANATPVLALTPHLGCFEIVAAYIGSRVPMTALYRPPKRADLEPIMRAGRERGLIKLAPADLSGVKRLLRALRQGEIAGLLPDQVPGNGEGMWSGFFGKPAYTMTLAARLSEAEGVRVVLFWGERLSGGRGYRIHVCEPAEAITGSLEQRVQAINREVERLVLRCPTQYLWGYNRYKIPAGALPPGRSA